MTTTTIPAREIREGDSIPGLDNAYCYRAAENNDTPYYDGRGVIARGDGLVSVCFHTAEGEEGELIVPEDMPVTIERNRP